ncbi:MAG: hypothetical protein Q7S92_05090 [Candidatus Diapherotrites archaeon]|nr:hypothetical protein [Candidatus Diapherotrites archaeon]
MDNKMVSGKVIVLFLLVLLSCTLTASAQSLSSEVENIQIQAQKYESQEISFLQLKMLLNQARENIVSKIENQRIQISGQEENRNELGWSTESIQQLLGEPTGYDEWLWFENLRQSKRVKEKIAKWEKTIWDGQKIKITLNAWPQALQHEQEIIQFYWIDLDLKFKKPEDRLEKNKIIQELDTAIQNYKNQTTDIKEFAKTTVELEKQLQTFSENNQKNCAAAMENFFEFTPQERLRTQWQGVLFEGQNFELELNLDEGKEPDHNYQYWNARVDFRPTTDNFKLPEFLPQENNLQEEIANQQPEELIQELKKRLNQIKEFAKTLDIIPNASAGQQIQENLYWIQEASNVLNQKANNQEYGYTLEKLAQDWEQIFQEFTTNYEKNTITEKRFNVLVLDEQKEQTSAYCQAKETDCGENNVCQNAVCVSALGGNEICDNQQDDDLDTLNNCEDPDCFETCRNPPEINENSFPEPQNSPEQENSISEPESNPENSNPGSENNELENSNPELNENNSLQNTGNVLLQANENESRCGESVCRTNQVCNSEKGWCDCRQGFFDCDGEWLNGCESQSSCKQCQTNQDCAQTRCSEDNRRLTEFECKQGDSYTENIASVELAGSCEILNSGEIRAGVWISAWGEGFENFNEFKQEYYSQDDKSHCLKEFESFKQERIELQKSLNNELLEWFYENSVKQKVNDFEKHTRSIRAIYESFIRVNGDLARSMTCLNMTQLPAEIQPISKVKLDAGNGYVEIWEEKKTTAFFAEGQQTQTSVEVISPYATFWFFPTREEFKEEFKKHFFEEGPESEGPSPDELKQIRNDLQVIQKIERISDLFGGEAKLVMEIRDGSEAIARGVFSIDPVNLVRFDKTLDKPEDTDVTLVVGLDFMYGIMEGIFKEQFENDVQKPYWEEQFEFEIDDALIEIKIFSNLIGGLLSGQIIVEPFYQLPNTLLALQELMTLMPKG